MSDGGTSSGGGGIGFMGLLTVLFIGLKLTGHIDWSWPWVLSPLWIGLAVGLGIILAMVVVAVILAFVGWLTSRN